MSRMRNPHADMGVGSIIGFKIEEYRQEDDPSFLAIRLAEALHNQGRHNDDANALRDAVMAERRKAMNIQSVIFQLKERARSGAVSTSRMDPLNTYDLETCELQFAQHKEQAQSLQEEVNKHVVQAEECKREAARLQRRIRELNASKRQP